MPGSTEGVAEPALGDAPRNDPQAPMDWHQRFPAAMSHEGHDVPDVGAVFEERMTLGQRAADAVARQLGSWRFLIIQSCLLVAWMVLNIVELLFKPFDPYPFILLNLVLSFQAAYAAPVLLMSANRQAQKDRLSARSASRGPARGGGKPGHLAPPRGAGRLDDRAPPLTPSDRVTDPGDSGSARRGYGETSPGCASAGAS
jgi:Protein of unknown function (DUF1003)